MTAPHNLIRLGISLLPRLTLRQYGLLILFVVVSVCAAVLEVASGASLALLASYLSPEGPVGNLGKVANLLASFQFPGLPKQESWILPAIFCGGVLLLANSFQIFAFFLRTQVSLAGLRRVRAILAAYYFSRDLGFYSRSHSSEAISAILTESHRLYSSALSPTAALIHSGTVALIVAGSAIFMNPRAGLTAGLVFLVAYTLYYFALRPVFQKSDAFMAEASRERQRLLQQGFEGMREFLFWGKRELLLEDFKKVDAKATRGEALSLFFASIPRNVLEILIVLSSLALALLLPARTFGAISLGELVFYGFAMLRLLPAMQQIFASMAQIQMGQSAARPVQRALQAMGRVKEGPVSGLGVAGLRPQVAIRLCQVSFRHDQSRGWALHDVDVEIPVGSLVAWVGSTGAGKSTAVDILAGLQIPQNGGVVVDGRLLLPGQLASWRYQLAYLPQHFYLLDASVEENIALGSRELSIDRRRVEEAAQAAHIDDFIKTLPRGYLEPLGERGVRLSGGQRQRLGLARVLYSRAPVILLDEPTSALDGTTEAGILATLAELKGSHTILVITHRESVWKYCDRVYRFEKGRVEQISTALETPPVEIGRR